MRDPIEVSKRNEQPPSRELDRPSKRPAAMTPGRRRRPSRDPRGRGTPPRPRRSSPTSGRHHASTELHTWRGRRSRAGPPGRRRVDSSQGSARSPQQAASRASRRTERPWRARASPMQGNMGWRPGTSTPVYENYDVTFPVTATDPTDGKPATGSQSLVEAYLDEIHPAPDTDRVSTRALRHVVIGPCSSTRRASGPCVPPLRAVQRRRGHLPARTRRLLPGRPLTIGDLAEPLPTSAAARQRSARGAGLA